MIIFPFYIPIAIVIGVFLLVACGARRSCRRGGAPIGLILLVVLGGLLMIGLRMLRMRSDFGGVPAIVRVSPARVQVATPLARPSTGPSTQTSQLWIDDWTAYVNTTNFNGFRAESSDVCPTEMESRAEAVRNASELLMQSLENDGRINQAMRKVLGNREIVRQRIESAIQSGSVVAGQYVYTTEKPYGTLWKTYLLIDTSQAKLTPLVQQLNRQITAQQRQTLTTAGSIAATVLVVLLLYAFLNTVTKGYFIWRLRAAVILAMIAAVMAVAVMI